MAQKTLVIGIGTSGAEIASGVIDRILASPLLGSMETATWIESLVVDTAPISTELSATQNGTSLNIGLEGSVYQEFIRAPERFAAMEFSTWHDPATIARTTDTIQGAGNVRMAGRASLMHSTSFAAFYNALREAITRLSRVDIQAEMQAAGYPKEAYSKATSQINVVVCGSLTGGTCSGTFLDVGYLLRSLPGYTQGLVTFGAFTLPHEAIPVPKHKANAYAALTELSHFHADGSRYYARLANTAVFPRPLRVYSRTPFDSVFLCRPRNSSKDDIMRVQAALSEMIFLQGTTEMGDAVLAKMVDPNATFANTRDVHGRHMNFSSLGLSVIEFPSEHIIRGCSYLLASEALKAWLEAPAIESGPASHLVTGLGATYGKLVEALTQPPKGVAEYEKQTSELVNRAVEHAKKGDLAAVAMAESTLAQGFDYAPNGSSGIEPGTFENWIKGNKRDVETDLLAAFSDRIARAMRTIDEGPNWVVGLCDETLRRCAEIERKAKEGNQRRLDDLKTAMDLARQCLQEIESSGAIRATPGWAGFGRRKYAEVYRQAAKGYWTARMEMAAGGAVEASCRALRGLVERVRVRVSGEGHGILTWARHLQGLCDSAHRAYDLKGPFVNGEALFAPGQTIGQEYHNAVGALEGGQNPEVRPNARGEEYAKADLITRWARPAEQALAPAQISAFDTPPATDLRTVFEASAAERDEIARLGRDFFADLKKVSVVERLFSDRAAPARLAVIASLGEPFLDVDDTDSPLGSAEGQDGRKVPYVFFNGASSTAGHYGTLRQSFMPFVQQDPSRLVESRDIQKIVLVKSRCVFAPYSVAGVDGYQPFWQDEATYGKHQSRMDVVWKRLDGKPLVPDLFECVGLFLFGLATGLIVPAAPVQDEDGRVHRRYTLELPEDYTKALTLNDDLDDDAYRISRSVAHKSFLRSRFQAKSEDNRGELINTLHKFLVNVPTQNASFRFDNRAVGEEWLKARLFNAMALVPYLLEAWYQRFTPEYAPKQEDYLYSVDEAKLRFGEGYGAGYYCRNTLSNGGPCSRFFGPIGMPETAFPRFCPNPECGKQLLLDGYVGAGGAAR